MTKRSHLLAIFILILLSFRLSLTFGNQCPLTFSDSISSSSKRSSDFNRSKALKSSWLEFVEPSSLVRLLTNISPSDAKAGAVVAAQTRTSPNYYYHWVRDAGLTMQAIISKYQSSRNIDEKRILKQKINEFLDFSESNQITQTLTGLGEPKFNVDGSAFNEAWGRPQNDGPAIRASALIQWFEVLEAEGGLSEAARVRFYDGKIPTDSVIKRDLEYISHHWREPSFDLWEEVKGDHFYTRMVQRRALVEGARLARKLGDSSAADWYSQQAKEIEMDLQNFWDSSRGHFIATRNRVGGLDYKNSGIDTAVILGLLHGSTNDGFLSFTDPRVEATVKKIISSFEQTYSINKWPGIPGLAIGRYPEDRYGGDNFNGGNPWPLATLAVAEIYYKMALQLKQQGQEQKALEFVQLGDQFVDRVKYHANPDGSLNEQMNRETGFMTSVRDLTWNYAAIITALFSKKKATGQF